jgi:hypothetical protein
MYRDQLWNLLRDAKRTSDGGEPLPPLILAGWSMPALAKMLREQHIQWAEKHSALTQAAGFLRGLRWEDWHHIGD